MHLERPTARPFLWRAPRHYSCVLTPSPLNRLDHGGGDPPPPHPPQIIRRGRAVQNGRGGKVSESTDSSRKKRVACGWSAHVHGHGEFLRSWKKNDLVSLSHAERERGVAGCGGGD